VEVSLEPISRQDDTDADMSIALQLSSSTTLTFDSMIAASLFDITRISYYLHTRAAEPRIQQGRQIPCRFFSK